MTFRASLVTMILADIQCEWAAAIEQQRAEEMMANITEVNEDNYQDEVLSASQPVLVDFSAVWCSPCKMLDPIVEQLAQEWNGKVKVVKLDVDHNPNIAMEYQVMGVPTLMLFVSGEPLERMTGFQPKDRITNRINPHLQTA
ncbi:MAG TPA: thioredoxin [Anaerolineales bacterium]